MLSFNRKYAGTSGWSETSMEAFPTDEEWNRIKPRLMSLRAKPRELSAQPVWMAKPGGPVYFRASTNYNRHLGLFDANDSIDVIAAWIDSTRILYEPGFSYDIRTDRDRLYPIARIDRSNRSITRIFPGFVNYDLPEKLPGYYKIKDSLWADRVQRIQSYWPKLQLVGPTDGRFHMLAVESIDTSFLVSYPDNRVFPLPAGEYRLRLFNLQDSLLERTVVLKQDVDRQLVSTTHLDWLSRPLDEPIRNQYYDWINPETYYISVTPSRRGPILLGENTISGRVIDGETGDPLIYAAVTLYDDDRNLLAGTFTDDNGNFYL
ncbi:MAG: carboxypeptidase-like regulatory domain-containing protein, partial [Bacteroidota bacterium]